MPVPQLRWRDPVLLERTGADDLDVLLLHEGRLVAADVRRAKCLASLRSLLRGQKYNRDRVRAHGGEGRDALRDTLVHGARDALATLLCELRLASAHQVVAMHPNPETKPSPLSPKPSALGLGPLSVRWLRCITGLPSSLRSLDLGARAYELDGQWHKAKESEGGETGKQEL